MSHPSRLPRQRPGPDAELLVGGERVVKARFPDWAELARGDGHPRRQPVNLGAVRPPGFFVALKARCRRPSRLPGIGVLPVLLRRGVARLGSLDFRGEAASGWTSGVRGLRGDVCGALLHLTVESVGDFIAGGSVRIARNAYGPVLAIGHAVRSALGPRGDALIPILR